MLDSFLSNKNQISYVSECVLIYKNIKNVYNQPKKPYYLKEYIASQKII